MHECFLHFVLHDCRWAGFRQSLLCDFKSHVHHFILGHRFSTQTNYCERFVRSQENHVKKENATASHASLRLACCPAKKVSQAWNEVIPITVSLWRSKLQTWCTVSSTTLAFDHEKSQTKTKGFEFGVACNSKEYIRVRKYETTKTSWR